MKECETHSQLGLIFFHGAGVVKKQQINFTIEIHSSGQPDNADIFTTPFVSEKMSVWLYLLPTHKLNSQRVHTFIANCAPLTSGPRKRLLCRLGNLCAPIKPATAVSFYFCFFPTPFLVCLLTPHYFLLRIPVVALNLAGMPLWEVCSWPGLSAGFSDDHIITSSSSCTAAL